MFDCASYFENEMMGMFELERHERSSKGTYYLRAETITEMLILAPFPLPTTPPLPKAGRASY